MSKNENPKKLSRKNFKNRCYMCRTWFPFKKPEDPFIM